MPVKIILYDDSIALRQSIEALLQMTSGIEFIVGKPTAENIEQDLEQLKPDVVLMDIDMPKVNGVVAVARIRKVLPALPIIMLTVFDDSDNIFKALCAGASGYILKRRAATELLDAIQMVMDGGAPMTGSVAKKVLQMLPKAKTKTEEEFKLSEKETAILQFMVQGYSYKMIAAELNRSLDTVRFHIKKIYNKLHVHSATGAVTKAINNKLV